MERESLITFRHENYYATILIDSLAHVPDRPAMPPSRLVSMEVCFPRFILAEFNTHRVLSRNSASSRAIPTARRIEQVERDAFVPASFSKNKSGMQATEEIEDQEGARSSWLRARDAGVLEARTQDGLKTHKQYANRLIELWAWHTVVVTSSRWENFFNLRTHKAAQPEMQIIAKLMKQAYEASTPRVLKEGEWHLPYISDETFVDHGEDMMFPIKLSVVKCAATSYERQAAERTQEQVEKRHDDMMRQAHWSPFEHAVKVASAAEIDRYALFKRHEPSVGLWLPTFEPVSIGNLDVPWLQYRKTIAGEDVWHDPEAL